MTQFEKLTDEILSLVVCFGEKIDCAEFEDEIEAGRYVAEIVRKIIAKVQEYDFQGLEKLLDEANGYR